MKIATTVVCKGSVQFLASGSSALWHSALASTAAAREVAGWLSSDHANWTTYVGTKPTAFEVAIVAWMREQLMGDTALRSWLYGSSCKLCTDTANWKVQQKLMDQ